MNEVTRHFCWHQNFVPWGLSAPTTGLYTCIKSWKKLYKIRLQRDFFETCIKWPKRQDVPVDIKTLSPRVVSHCPRLYILTDKRNATTKSKLFYSSSNFELVYWIHQQKLLAVSCFEGISNFVQQYHQTESKTRPKFDVTDAKFEFEFPEDLDTLIGKEGTR